MTYYNFIASIECIDSITASKVGDLFDEDLCSDFAEEQYWDADENYMGIPLARAKLKEDEDDIQGFFDMIEFLTGRAFTAGYSVEENRVFVYFYAGYTCETYWRNIIKYVEGINKVEVYVDPEYPEDVEELEDLREVYEK